MTDATTSTSPRPAKVDYKRIATEEAWAPPEMLTIYRRILDNKEVDDPGFRSLWGFYGQAENARSRFIREGLTDIGEQRIRHMDERGIDRQILGLTAPGVQVMGADEAVGFARASNDQLAEACRKHPDRFTGLAACAPQRPDEAAKEIERGISRLGFKGVIINSHTHGEFMSDPKFWPIFEAAEALDAPVYLHPRGAPPTMIQPFVEAGLDGAIFGFGVETGLHALRIITSGVFDRFPRLKLVIGHLGEALPFWLFRLDYMHDAGMKSKRYSFMPELKMKISDYMRKNVYVTSSGMADPEAIMYCQRALGVDRVLYAMDYPYQCPVEEVIASDSLPIPHADLVRFFQTNAEQVFKLTGGGKSAP